MKAFTANRYGKNDKLQLADAALPNVKPNDLLVQVNAAGVNLLDSLIRKGGIQAIPAIQTALYFRS